LGVIQALFFLLFPAVILLAVKKSRRLKLLSPILLSYLAGIILANLGFISLDKTLAMTIAEFSVPLAIPLVLFSTDFVRWLRLARSTIISFCLVIVSGMASSLLAARIFASRVEEFWQVAGMLTGVYTGGTPNLMAIGLALGVSEETFILVNTSDVIMGGLYLIFLMMAAQRLLRKFLPAFIRAEDGNTGITAEAAPILEQGAVGVAAVVKSLALAVLIVGASVGLSLVIYGDLVAPLVILTVTTLGLAASFHERIRNAPATYESGHYLLLVFSLAIGTTVNFKEMVSASPQLFLYTATVMTGAVILHFLLAALFRIDVDTVIITSTAGIYGPAFIAPIAGVLKNREVVVSGLTTALVGYALGNYLGLAVAYLLRP
jgi:uncharacterized membrane protein